MKRMKLLFGILALLLGPTIFGQQNPQYTQYMYNMVIINPAYAGSRGVPTIGILGRTQWVGVDGAPQTGTLSLSAPMSKFVGLGLSIIHDQIGPVKESKIYADFSYTIPTGKESNLAFGIKGGISLLDVMGDLITIEPGDPLNVPVNQQSPNFGAGLFYYTNKYYVGLSVPNILESRHLDYTGGVVSTASEKMHYFLTAGYVFDIGSNTKLKPSTMIKATGGAPVSFDFSLNALFNDKVEVGVNYRLDDSLSGMIGFQVSPDFRIGYAYDHSLNYFGDFNSGTHEIMLLFEFNRTRFKSPRFF